MFTACVAKYLDVWSHRPKLAHFCYAILKPMESAQQLQELIDSNDMVTLWSYEMRREIQLITPYVYLGPYSILRDTKTISSIPHLSHIVLIRSEAEVHVVRPRPDLYNNVPTHVIVLDDSAVAILLSAIKELNTILSRGGVTLVLCSGGISRGPAVVIGYLMQTAGVSFEKAYSYVQNRRFCINPNQGFKQQLMAFESLYSAMNDISQYSHGAESERTSIRRKAEQPDHEKRTRMYIDMDI